MNFSALRPRYHLRRQGALMPTAAAASAQVDPLAQSVRALISGRAAGAGAGACVDVTAMHQYGQRELLLYATKKRFTTG